MICSLCKHYALWHEQKTGPCEYRADGAFCACPEFNSQTNNRTYRVTLDIEISSDRGIPPVFRLVDSKIVRDEFEPPEAA